MSCCCTLLLAMAANAARQRSSRDWNSMTQGDWARIEAELEEPEDRRLREQHNAELRARQAQAAAPEGIDMEVIQRATSDEERKRLLRSMQAAAGGIKPKPQGKGMALGYVFITVVFDGCDGFEGGCPSDRKAITSLARKWSMLLQSIGMHNGLRVYKDHQIALNTEHETFVDEIVEFVMQQPEAALVRHDMVDQYGPAATTEWRDRHERVRAEREAAKKRVEQRAKKQQTKRRADPEGKAATPQTEKRKRPWTKGQVRGRRSRRGKGSVDDLRKKDEV